MEKELIINGVKYVKCEEPKTDKANNLINYNRYKLIVIKVKSNELILRMKNCLPPRGVNNGFSKDFNKIAFARHQVNAKILILIFISRKEMMNNDK